MEDLLSSFEVHTILPLNIFGLDISMTNSSLFMLLTTLIVIAVLALGTRKSSLVPGKMQVAVESLFFYAGSIVKTNGGKNGILLFPYMFSLFLFIMFGNLMGLLPFAFSFTSQIIVTMGMSFTIFIISIVIGIARQGKKYFRHFCPVGIPHAIAPFIIVVEIMSFFFRPISLGLRLFANMVSGHIMIKVMAGFALSIACVPLFATFSVVPIAVNVLLNIFKMLVCVLQARLKRLRTTEHMLLRAQIQP